jgi:Zn-dependent protease with chaperone function
MPVPGRYFDGRTSRAHTVQFDVVAGIAQLRGEVTRDCPTDQLRVSEKMQHVARRITYPDDAFVEIEDEAGIDDLLAEHGHRESLVSRMQQSWRATLIAVFATVGVIIAGYLYGVPAASSILAKALPEKVERRLGQEALTLLDSKWFAPSALSLERQQNIIKGFQRLQPAYGSTPEYEILFRKSRIGPNAFALPAGKIVITDELIHLLDDDEAINAVLAHELGHLHERHLAQRVIQSSLIGAATATLFGDVSSTLAALPTLLLDLRYSRDAEREADDFAARMLQANGMPPSKLGLVFQKLDDGESKLPPYLSTHPSASERMERLHELH